jgi:hypothetical protein
MIRHATLYVKYYLLLGMYTTEREANPSIHFIGETPVCVAIFDQEQATKN